MSIRFSNLITTFLFFYSCITISTTNSAVLKEYFESNYITEIINNTDKAIVVQVSLIYPYITKSISLTDGEVIEHLKKPNYYLTIAPRTKALIADLKIPTVNAASPTLLHSDIGDAVREFFNGSYISFNFHFHGTIEVQPMSFIGLRQKGNKLEIRTGEGLKSLSFNGLKDLEKRPFWYSDMIENNSTYTVEVNQASKAIIHRKRTCAGQLYLVKNTLDVIVRKNAISAEDVALKNITVRPSAYIESFASNFNNCMVAVIKFANLKTEKALDHFYDFTRRNQFVQKFTEVTRNDRGLSLTFYTDITKDQVQALVDEINRAPLD